jgi:hypothetical protein
MPMRQQKSRDSSEWPIPIESLKVLQALGSRPANWLAAISMPGKGEPNGSDSQDLE